VITLTASDTSIPPTIDSTDGIVNVILEDLLRNNKNQVVRLQIVNIMIKILSKNEKYHRLLNENKMLISEKIIDLLK